MLITSEVVNRDSGEIKSLKTDLKTFKVKGLG